MNVDRRRFLVGIGAGAAAGIAGCTDENNGRLFADADWRDGDGLDLETLAENHSQTLVDAGGITLFSTAETSHDGDEEPSPWLPTQTYESGYDLENERQYVRQEIPDDEQTEVSELYVADGEMLLRQQVGEAVQYDRRSVERSLDELTQTMRDEVVTGIRVGSETEAGEAEFEGLNLWNPTSDGESEIRGEPTARFTSETFDGDRNIPATVETAAATVYVLESGVVPRLEQSWEGEHDGQQADVDIDIDYRDPGAEIAEPDWTEEARA